MPLRPSVLVLTLPALLLAACSGGPEAAVKGFYAALDDGRVDRAAGFLSRRIVQTLGEEKLHATLEEFAGQIAGCGGLDRVTVTLEGEGDTRHGTSQVRFRGQCPVQDNTVVVVREAEGWKLGLGK